MSRNHGFRKNKSQNKSTHHKQQLDENNAVQRDFKQYSLLLDDKHDRYERIIKLSRDVTIESKRIIFLLHSIEQRKNNREKNLQEAAARLQKIIEVNFKAIAKELNGHDVYQYRGAYSPGLQEFIEAYTFMEYLKYEDSPTSVLSDWRSIQNQMKYVEESMDKSNKNEDKDNEIVEVEVSEHDDKDELGIKSFEFFICPSEYILGLSDLTGELMRRCINALGSGETNTCMETSKALKQFYTGYISLNTYRARELHRKISTMRQSLLKVENVCYNVKVRGGEAAKWGAVFDAKPNECVDEGFF